MRRIEPALPDLLPLTHRFGPPPAVGAGRTVTLDPVEMRLVWRAAPKRHGDLERSVPRRPVRVLLHARVARTECEFFQRVIAAGSGVLLVLDDEVGPKGLPAPSFEGQIVVLAPWLPPFWGGGRVPKLKAWRSRGIAGGVLVCLAPAPDSFDQIAAVVDEAKDAGATFILGGPLSIPPEERHRIYDGRAGEGGDEELENLLFHTDLAQLAVDLERELSRACRRAELPEGLPGPSTAGTTQSTFAAGARLLLWARRLDLMDGVGSAGWQLRRAAHALLASRRDARALLAEDNLRVIPGFTPWVEAFARSAWSGAGEPFEEVLARWLAH